MSVPWLSLLIVTAISGTISGSFECPLKTGQKKQPGEKWIVGDYQYSCNVINRHWRIEVSGCNMLRFGRPEIVAVGESSTIHNVTTHCVKKQDGTVTMVIDNEDLKKCNTNEGEKSNGELWWHEEILYECKSTVFEGRKRATACNAGKYGLGIISVGSSRTSDKIEAKCIEDKFGTVKLVTENKNDQKSSPSGGNGKFGAYDKDPVPVRDVAIPQSECPADWTEKGTVSYFKLTPSPKTFEEAEAACRKRNSNAGLSYFVDRAEYDEFRQYVNSTYGNPYGYTMIRLAINDKSEEGKFEITMEDGTSCPAPFLDWSDTNPNNEGSGEEENCSEYYYQQHKMNDVGCWRQRETLCQIRN